MRETLTFRIPEIGDEITLAENWTFRLYEEYRNRGLIDLLEIHEPEKMKEWMEVAEKCKARSEAALGPDCRIVDQAAWDEYNRLLEALDCWFWEFTLPKGTKLAVDRIYIRKGASDFSSLSFYISNSPDKRLKPRDYRGGFGKGRLRFWAKLADVNAIQFEIPESVYAAI